MPTGMGRSQHSIALPNTRRSKFADRRCAAAANPYGPAPTIATWVVPLIEKLLDIDDPAIRFPLAQSFRTTVSSLARTTVSSLAESNCMGSCRPRGLLSTITSPSHLEDVILG